MNRIALASLVLLVILAAPVIAQDATNVFIFTEPAGVEYFVDGQRYAKPSSFLWPKGSKHVVHIDNAVLNRSGMDVCTPPGDSAQYDPNCSTRYGFQEWSTNLGGAPNHMPTHIVTADPAITFLKATFRVEYRVQIATMNQPGSSAPDVCGNSLPLGPRPAGAGPGLVYIGGQCLQFATTLWLGQGDYPIMAAPFEGWIFRGWSLDGGVTTGYMNVLSVTGPRTLHPMFEPAKRVRLYTSPYELQLRIDRTVIPTVDPRTQVPKYPMPGYFDWARGSTHILGAVSPQTSLDGKVWVFDSWTNGGGQDMTYNAGDEVNVITELTANFVRGVGGNIMTSPDTLKVKVDDRDNAPYTFVWKIGAKVKLSAPAEQTDSRGRKYSFKGWSNGGPATQEITVEESHIESGIRLLATYEAMPQAIVQSSVPGIPIKIDGADCASPCKIDRQAGKSVRISAPAVLPVSEVTRWEFDGWTDGGDREHVISFDRDSQTVVAKFRKANRLIAILDPPESAAVRTDPASTDGFFPADWNIRVTLEPRPGFRFRRWDGDLSGTFSGGTLNMGGSRVIRALFDRVPFVSDSGVRNAAGATPESGVAAGSLVSIFGASLANGFEASRGNPLAQTLGGAVVMVEDRILPLVYVSPEQINAQLPNDLQPGNYTIVVRPEGLGDIKAQFTVVRNAPGLFNNSFESVAYSVALHEDGSPITLASPARRDEVVTFLGTGFGPYDRRTIDGFMTVANPVVNVADPIEVRLGGILLRPAWSGPVPGYTGVAGARVKLGGIPSGRHETTVVVNGIASNTVVLPVE